jgi:hypothetical protein
MSKVFGFKIGKVGLEFPSREDREKALVKFTRAATVKVNESSGIVYEDGDMPFGTYERDTKEVSTKCYVCNGIFTLDTCSQRQYQNKPSYSNTYSKEENFICDGCFAAKEKEYEVHKAKELLRKGDDDD